MPPLRAQLGAVARDRSRLRLTGRTVDRPESAVAIARTWVFGDGSSPGRGTARAFCEQWPTDAARQAACGAPVDRGVRSLLLDREVLEHHRLVRGAVRLVGARTELDRHGLHAL